MIRYVHTLVFLCPQCAEPVAVAEVRAEQNLENADATMYRARCVHCDHEFDILGVMAKVHWVNEWPAARIAAAGA